MKKAWILIMTITMAGVFSLKSNAQLSLGLNGGICLPQNSDVKSAYNSGFGGSLNAEFNIAKVGIGLNVGDYFFLGKDLTGVTNSSFLCMPIIADVKYYFFPIIFKPFLGVGAGMFIDKSKFTISGTSISPTTSENKFGISPELGFALGLHTKLVVSAKYNIILKGDGDKTFDYISLNLGVMFPLI
jgi:hypothetical protein